MAHQEITPLVNKCRWVTRYRDDGSAYRSKVSDCGRTDCRYSDNYVPPPQQNVRDARFQSTMHFQSQGGFNGRTMRLATHNPFLTPK
ncbi:hypothetical protein K505DRAFT_255150 [Melanomma pulvis-pyrius CBS 109.77]|uniref:Uncharacterized protein n=1 Tax=Melanomma pulvis-pyrius CBS 109.77 TaxID=1314802 RepID=A0A6A6WWL2_9PLEO|nr:hypothetical protein K505DRAFT_255150 [Melanomma pulvis-pyrius CBS 109.77]